MWALYKYRMACVAVKTNEMFNLNAKRKNPIVVRRIIWQTYLSLLLSLSLSPYTQKQTLEKSSMGGHSVIRYTILTIINSLKVPCTGCNGAVVHICIMCVCMKWTLDRILRVSDPMNSRLRSIKYHGIETQSWYSFLFRMANDDTTNMIHFQCVIPRHHFHQLSLTICTFKTPQVGCWLGWTDTGCCYFCNLPYNICIYHPYRSKTR